MCRVRSRFFVFVPVLCSAFVCFAVSSTAQTTDAELLARVGNYVERFYARAQTIVATETVTVEPV